MTARWMVLGATGLAALAGPVLAQQRPATAAAVAGLRIQFRDTMAIIARSGLITFDRQGLNTTATVVGIDTAGKPIALARFSPRWTSSDPKVVSTYGNPSDNPVGASMTLVAQEDGRATITVTAAGKSASIPVVVGAARREIAASELTPGFRVARLEVVAEPGRSGPEAEVVDGGVRLRENGHGVLLRALAFAADGTSIPLDYFPVTWETVDAKVVELYQTGPAQTQTTARDPGGTVITAAIQGIRAEVNAEVVKMGTTVGPMQGTHVVAREGAASATAANVPATAPVTASSTTTATGTAPPAAVPSTTQAPTAIAVTQVKPVTGTVGTVSSGGTTTATTNAPIASGTPITKGESVATAATTLAAPTVIQAVPLAGGYVSVAWRPVPNATGYYLLQQLPDGKWAGATLVGNAGVPDTIATTMALPQGPVTLAVVAVAGDDGAVRSPPSAPVSATIPRWNGRYRVSVLGFKVNRETRDDPIETDGKRDEVYVRVGVQAFELGQPAGAPFTVQSRVHGDINAADWQSGANRRIKAGAASALGGLMTGNAFPTGTPWIRFNASDSPETFPLAVWEGDLFLMRNEVVFAPSVWESDRRPNLAATIDFGAYDPELELVKQVGQYVAKRFPTPTTEEIQSLISLGATTMTSALYGPAAASVPALALQGVPPWAVRSAIRIMGSNIGSGAALLKDAVADADAIAGALRANAQVYPPMSTFATSVSTSAATTVANYMTALSSQLNLLLNTRDRPIGMATVNGAISGAPKIFTLDYVLAERMLQAPDAPGMPAGVKEIRFTDRVTSPGGNGDYSIYVQVQRLR